MPKRSQRKQRFTGMPEMSVSVTTIRAEAGKQIRDRDMRRMELADQGKLGGQSIYRPAPLKPAA